jgi:hypothetical protein
MFNATDSMANKQYLVIDLADEELKTIHQTNLLPSTHKMDEETKE